MRCALIAGRGSLPAAVAAELEAPLVCSLRDNLPDGLTPAIVFRVEQLGSFIERLKAEAVTEVCFCGAVSRPEVDFAALDAATLPLVPVLQRALQPGDDGALRAIIAVFEHAGFAVRGAHELAPALLPAAGPMVPTLEGGPTQTELTTARAVSEQFARIDEGQACVVRGSEVIAREDPRGTDAMLADLAQPHSPPPAGGGDPVSWLYDAVGEALDDAADWLSGPEAERARLKGAGAILYKAPKPGQDRRADLPTIGPKTVEGAARAGLRGIVVAAGGVIVLDRARVMDLCLKAGVFLVVQDVG